MRYVAIRSEGGLLPYDLLDKIVADQVSGQKPGDFGLPRGQRLIDELSRVWADAQNLWSTFKRRRESLSERDPYGTSITRSWILSLLSGAEMLGFDLTLQTSAVVVNDLNFAISHRDGDGDNAIPTHIEGCKIDLDRRLHTKLRTSPQAMLQNFLNSSEYVTWGILTNGATLRLLRDSSRTSRPTYLEFDLESVLEGNRFNEFSLFYRLCHRTRFPQPGHEASDCLLEKYYLDSIEQGLRVRDKLRDGVEEALKILGTAFLRHPANEKLRGDHAAGRLTPDTFHRQLLLLVYRLLFLMVAEERGLIVALGERAAHNQNIYDEWYSVARLRERAARIVEASPFGDLWIGLKRTFSLFEYGLDTNALGIPPLNGDLFDEKRAIPDLTGTELYNHELLLAVRHLSLFKAGTAYQRVNYSGLDVEELGSVYESLLDYKPVIAKDDKGFAFGLLIGMERKSTGSYYTRPELVHELVESALVAVMEERLAEAEKSVAGKDLVEERNAKINAILSLTVCDPACGSGHFLLAAARRLGKELARVRTDEDEPRPEDFHRAVREVISHCIYGVDLNPLAVDLCKLALWLEGHWAGMPLSFLDHRIRCGNSLVGVLDPNVMTGGIPDEAFTAVTGDDKKVAAALRKRNKQDRTSRGFSFEAENHSENYAEGRRQLEAIPDDTAASVRRKAEVFSSWRGGMQHFHDQQAADLWTAQFFIPLTEAYLSTVCTTKEFLEFAIEKQKKPLQVGVAQALAQENRFFHWHLEFPEIVERGGFDVVLGNPPWERIKLQEEEHWADEAYISKAKNKAERTLRIKEYRESNDSLKRDRVLRFDLAKHAAEAETKFIRQSNKFPLCAVGDVNTYALFAELVTKLIGEKGRSGIVVPVGIATDHTTQAFFRSLVGKQRLVRLTGFENEEFIFPSVHNEFKFCTLTACGAEGHVHDADLAFFCRRFEQVTQPERHFSLSREDLALLNPNTNTCPIFRTGIDALLTKAIYRRVPILVNEEERTNPWGIELSTMFHMANDSNLFRSSAALEEEGFVLDTNRYRKGGLTYLPLYEAKMIWQYDHRFASLLGIQRGKGKRPSRKFEGWYGVDVTDTNEVPIPQYWVLEAEVDHRLQQYDRQWLLGFRDITNATNERTCVFAVVPRGPVGHTMPLVFVQRDLGARDVALFLANVNSLVFDYIARQKLGGTHLTYSILNQLPVLPLRDYRAIDRDFISKRAIELTYTAHDLDDFGKDVGLSEPFVWEDTRRAILRAELDAYFAHLYGLTRDELEYICDPRDIFGADFPSISFRVLRLNEEKEFGEYRTRRLVLNAFDQLAETERFRNDMPHRTSSLEVSDKTVFVAVR